MPKLQLDSKLPRHLVLGLAENYRFDHLAPFVFSLRRTGYSGDIVFFARGLDRETRTKLREHGVTQVPFRNLRGAATGHARLLLDWVSHQYHLRKWPWYRHGWRHLLRVTRLRYYLYHRFLHKHGHRYARVLLTDTRDVFFQRDPFADPLAEELAFFEESHALNFGKINATWLRSQLGEEILTRLGSCTTLCAGTTMGTPAALCAYLEKMAQTIRRAGCQDLPHGDQAIHNAVVYEELSDIPFSKRIFANGDRHVITLTQYLASGNIHLGAEGDVLGTNGDVMPIVHQYDRHPEVARRLLEKIRG